MDLETKCRQHWKCLGITSLDALKDNITKIFSKHEHQEYILIDLYRMILPDWDHIERIDGYPEAGNALWKFICNNFIEFDQKHHPDVFKGGIWLNTGFSANSNLDPWDINFENCKIIMMD